MKGLIPKTKLFWKRHGSLVLTCFGAAGVIATAVSAATATPKAVKLVEMEEEYKGSKLTAWEKIKTAAPAYIPTAMIGAATVGCIFGAHSMDKRSQAALVTLYSMVDRSYKQYKEKAAEILGEDADQKIMKAIANDRYTMEDHKPIMNGQARFMDFYSLQIFDSTLETVATAEKIVNEILRTRGYVFLNEYYAALGIPSIDDDYETGWSSTTLNEESVDWLEFVCEQSSTEDGESYYIISMSVPPVHNCYF